MKCFCKASFIKYLQNSQGNIIFYIIYIIIKLIPVNFYALCEVFCKVRVLISNMFCVRCSRFTLVICKFKISPKITYLAAERQKNKVDSLQPIFFCLLHYVLFANGEKTNTWTVNSIAVGGDLFRRKVSRKWLEGFS